MDKKLIAWGAFVGITVFLLNILANLFYWYTSIWWFDMLMHTLGGLFIAIIIGALFVGKSFKNINLFFYLILAVFIIGIFWEGYEYIVQFFIKSVHLADIPDSISDLICDIFGGVIGSYFVINQNKSYNK